MARELITTVGLGLAVAAGLTLATKYEKDRTLRIETKSTVEMETTSFSMERDGEPVEGRMGGGGSSSDVRTVVQLDTVLESADGAPTKVRRVYETAEGSTSRTFGDQSSEQERESPFSGLELVLTLEDGEVAVEVVDGDEPEDELLAGHRLDLALDALLPADEVAEGDTWELDSAAIARALGADLDAILFPRPRVEEEPSGGGEGRGGGMRGGRGPGVFQLLVNEEWEGEAKLVSESEETDEGTGAVIEFTAECSGDVPVPEDRGGFDRELAIATALASGPVARRQNTYEIKLEGRLVFSPTEGRPIHMRAEAKIVLESHTTRTRGESEITIDSTQEGTLAYEVTVSAEKPADQDK
ncbi:MAG: hypothetical protein AB1726_02675 [Planctomycetota bacterium]